MLDFFCSIWLIKDFYGLKSILFTTYLLQWLKCRTLTTLKAVKDVEQQELFHSLLVEMQTSTVTLEDRQFLTKLNILLPNNQSINWAPRYLPKGADDLCPLKDLTNVYSSFIHNCQKKWKQPRCSSIV